MVKPLSLQGRIFSRLTVEFRAKSTAAGKALWVCSCSCGGSATVTSGALMSGNSKSCGCLRDEATTARSTTHGHAPRSGTSRTYASWSMMLARCENKNFPKYQSYGAKGVTVCKRWHKFENFLSDMGPRPARKSIDRINVYGNYTPRNCRWATAKQQAANKRK